MYHGVDMPSFNHVHTEGHLGSLFLFLSIMDKTNISMPGQVFVCPVLIFLTDPQAVAGIYDFPLLLLIPLP